MPPRTPCRCLVAAALFLAAVLPAIGQELSPAAPEKVGLSRPALKEIDNLLQDAVARKKVAGAVALVVRHGMVGYAGRAGVRDSGSNAPMAADTIFRIASMTKPITSVAALMLCDQGKLRLDDKLGKHLPEFGLPKIVVPGKGDKKGKYFVVPINREITVRDLLTHTSGITAGFTNRAYLSEVYRKAGVSDGLVQTEGTLADNIRRLAPLPLLFEPSTAWEYGLSTDVLGRVVEAASGESLAAFFRRHIFEPLAMQDTSFFLPADKKHRLAGLYTVGKDGMLTQVAGKPLKVGNVLFSASYPYLGPRTYFSGGAGLVSTAPDYARFLRMLLAGGKLGKVRLLKEETVRQMTRNQVGNLRPWISSHGDGFGYGFGLVTEAGQGKGLGSVGTYSWGGLFYTYFWVDPRQDLIGILMTQVYPNDQLTLRDDFRKLVYRAISE